MRGICSWKSSVSRVWRGLGWVVAGHGWGWGSCRRKMAGFGVGQAGRARSLVVLRVSHEEWEKQGAMGAEVRTLHGHIRRGWGTYVSQGLVLRGLLMVLPCVSPSVSSPCSIATFPETPLGPFSRSTPVLQQWVGKDSAGSDGGLQGLSLYRGLLLQTDVSFLPE